MVRANGILASDAASSAVGDDSIYEKVTRRIVPLLFMCYVVAYLDRVNVGFAKIQMLADLKFSETVYGLGAGIFFLGYFLFEVPSNILLHRVGARLWIARVMITWSIVSAVTLFVKTPTMFYALRFVLGLAEAGLFPGVILYLTYWYPARRRANILALFITGIPIAGVVGAPLSGWIMNSVSGAHNLAGWQWLFLIEAIPSLVMGIVVLLFLDNNVESARWLSANEKALLARNLADDRQGAQSHRMRDGFTNPRVWLMCVLYFFIMMGLYGVGFYLPTLIRNTGVSNPLSVGLLTALPYAVAVVAMLLVSRHSDAHQERRWHITIPALAGTLGWIASAVFMHEAMLATIALAVATAAVLVTMTQFWVLPTAMLTGAAAASGIAVINSVGNLAGFVSPYLIGGIIDATHSTLLAVVALAISMFVVGALALTLPKRMVNR
ncbi:MFS transporter [Paraburkholderia sp.]|jgi:MFS family permease|uniref:MFS transporter n=1 Tax=Paraburkholderia sp. TaxID=1926495 RepID=UPI00262AE4D0|nr:MFS transporter [Paraburkholderia sp.]